MLVTTVPTASWRVSRRHPPLRKAETHPESAYPGCKSIEDLATSGHAKINNCQGCFFMRNLEGEELTEKFIFAVIRGDMN